MKVINVFLISALFAFVGVPAAFGVGSAQKVATENPLDSHVKAKVLYLTEGSCSFWDPRCKTE